MDQPKTFKRILKKFFLSRILKTKKNNQKLFQKKNSLNLIIFEMIQNFEKGREKFSVKLKRNII